MTETGNSGKNKTHVVLWRQRILVINLILLLIYKIQIMKKIDDKICLHPVRDTLYKVNSGENKISIDEYNIESWSIH